LFEKRHELNDCVLSARKHVIYWEQVKQEIDNMKTKITLEVDSQQTTVVLTNSQGHT
jgi:hypothetical protein